RQGFPHTDETAVFAASSSGGNDDKFVINNGLLCFFQRSVYKDLVLTLQKDSYLSLSQLKSKMTNGTSYREVRQYRTDHHLVKFYFVTRVFSAYMESILAAFEKGIKPDVVVVNSCVWDVSRYNCQWASDYKENLTKFFRELKRILPKETLVLWNMTMPLGKKITGGFLIPEIQHMGPTLRFDVVEANFLGATLASEFGFDVLDLHFQFRFSLQHRMHDGVHWNAIAHRKITTLLLEHMAEAWGVALPRHDQQIPDFKPAVMQEKLRRADPLTPAHHQGPYSNERYLTPSCMSDPGWMQGQAVRPLRGFHAGFNGFGPQITGAPFTHFEPHIVNDVPPYRATSYPVCRDRNYPVDAPCWPGNNLVIKTHHRRQYKPYSRNRL
ncbi:hypothetical protein DNTS_013619, partial [Danionella cerebrum]